MSKRFTTKFVDSGQNQFTQQEYADSQSSTFLRASGELFFNSPFTSRIMSSILVETSKSPPRRILSTYDTINSKFESAFSNNHELETWLEGLSGKGALFERANGESTLCLPFKIRQELVRPLIFSQSGISMTLTFKYVKNIYLYNQRNTMLLIEECHVWGCDEPSGVIQHINIVKSYESLIG
jgi:hypothetical protein